MTRRNIYFCSMNRDALLPLVWGCLRAQVEADPVLHDAYQFAPPFFFLEQCDTLLDRVVAPDVFLISNYVWNLEKNLGIAKLVKERFPNVSIVAGGPHVPDQPAALFDRATYIDYAIHNEGEIALVQLLHQLLMDSPDLKRVSGLSYRDASGIVRSNNLTDRLGKTIETESPWLCGYFDASIAEVRDAGLVPYALWETNRGCPYSCTFCDWGSANMQKLRIFPMERLEAEISYFADRRIEAVLCCDANFGILKRDFQLAEMLIEAKTHKGFPQRFVTSYTKNPNETVLKMTKLFADSGLSPGPILAMQSVDESVLDAAMRKNIPIASYREFAGGLRGLGIRSYTELILGLPQETKTSWIEGLFTVLEMDIHDDMMVYDCLVLPNAQLGTSSMRQQHGLKTIKRSYLNDDVEMVEVLIGTNTMTSVEWVECWVFTQFLQALHNLSLTRWLAIYLHREGIASYAQFYHKLFNYFSCRPNSLLGCALARIARLQRDFIADSNMPYEGRIYTQPNMLKIAQRADPSKRDWLLHEWTWAFLIQKVDLFFSELSLAFDEIGIERNATLSSLLTYQRNCVVTLDYDAEQNNISFYQFNWPVYFENDDLELRCELTFLDFKGPPTMMRAGRAPNTE